MELVIILVVVFGMVFYFLLGGGHERERDLKERTERAKLELIERRICMMKEQERGVVERYRQTQENRVNAMLRQIKQEEEIKKLKAQVEILRRELGYNDDFTPEP